MANDHHPTKCPRAQAWDDPSVPCECPPGWPREAVEYTVIHCPKCGDGAEAEVAPTGLIDHPSVPCLLCMHCGTLWRLTFHEVKEGGGDG